MFQSEERKEKSKRIEELKEAGFNIPRQFYLYQNAHSILLENVLSWASALTANVPNQYFNIRTYKYYPNTQKETSQNPHLTDLSYDELLYHLPIQMLEYSCLVDAETPDNGRIAGNIAIEEDKKFSLEFVIKDKRAMVRDTNHHTPLYSISGYHRDISRAVREFSLDTNNIFSNRLVLAFVIKEALMFGKINTILEFTHFSTPAGIFYNNEEINFPKKNVVFWEYRRF